jgi:selenide, water dikinase
VFDEIPFLAHARNLAARGVVPGGTKRNFEAAVGVEWDDDIAPADRLLLADAQTSGGLLLAVPPENVTALVEALRTAETPAAAVIGRLTEGPTGSVRVVRRA